MQSYDQPITATDHCGVTTALGLRFMRSHPPASKSGLWSTASLLTIRRLIVIQLEESDTFRLGRRSYSIAVRDDYQNRLEISHIKSTVYTWRTKSQSPRYPSGHYNHILGIIWVTLGEIFGGRSLSQKLIDSLTVLQSPSRVHCVIVFLLPVKMAHRQKISC